MRTTSLTCGQRGEDVLDDVGRHGLHEGHHAGGVHVGHHLAEELRWEGGGQLGDLLGRKRLGQVDDHVLRDGLQQVRQRRRVHRPGQTAWLVSRLVSQLVLGLSVPYVNHTGSARDEPEEICQSVSS